MTKKMRWRSAKCRIESRIGPNDGTKSYPELSPGDILLVRQEQWAVDVTASYVTNIDGNDYGLFEEELEELSALEQLAEAGE